MTVAAKDRIGNVTAMTMGQFKRWLDDGCTGEPVADQVSKYVKQKPGQGQRDLFDPADVSATKQGHGIDPEHHWTAEDSRKHPRDNEGKFRTKAGSGDTGQLELREEQREPPPDQAVANLNTKADRKHREEMDAALGPDDPEELTALIEDEKDRSRKKKHEEMLPSKEQLESAMAEVKKRRAELEPPVYNKKTMTAATLKTAMEDWNQDETDDYSLDASNRMVEVAKQLFSALPGARSVELETATAGSFYIAITPDHDDANDVIVRLSNHQRKPSGHLSPAWSFEPGDSIKSFEQGVSAVAKAIQDEIENANEIFG